jgi:Fic family protein
MTQYKKITDMWHGFGIKTVAELDMRLQSFRILFAYNSGKIENAEITYNNTREIFEDEKTPSFCGRPDTLTEISNQKKCYEFLLPKIIKKEPITLALIKEVHEITTMATYDSRRYFELGERPGEFKKHDFVVGKNETGSAPQDVESEISSLLEELYSQEPLTEPLAIFKASTYFHAWFEAIHPFADGNGRVGRTLMNYFLMTHNHPPLIIYDQDRKNYYSGLEIFCKDENIQPLFEFFQNQLEETWKKTLQRSYSCIDRVIQ